MYVKLDSRRRLRMYTDLVVICCIFQTENIEICDMMICKYIKYL